MATDLGISRATLYRTLADS
ncbi:MULTISPECIES: hypothetical protein [Corynebacterium]